MKVHKQIILSLKRCFYTFSVCTCVSNLVLILFYILVSVRWPPFVDVTMPDDFGLVGVRNYYLEVEENCKIGVWCVFLKSIIFFYVV